MKVLVCGATGCVGAAVVHALRARGHKVIEGARGAADGRATMRVDYMQPSSPQQWSARLAAAQVEAVVNCAGILMPSRGQTFERVHSQGPIELFRGAALAGVRRIVQVSALGVRGDADTLATPYLHSKLLADEALAALPLDWAVLRPSLVYGPRSRSAALFATLASLPLVALPGRGGQRVQPIHVYELAEAIARLLEQPGELREVHELGGSAALSYREMLAHYRRALGLGDALWLPLPMPLMRLTARLAEAVPQKVLCRDTIRLLERGSVPLANATPALLGRTPTSMPHGLSVTPPQPLVDLQVRLSPALAAAARASLAFMWFCAAVIVASLPQAPVALQWLAGTLGVVLGVQTLRRPVPWLYAVQAVVLLGCVVVFALNLPGQALALATTLPLLALVLLLWCQPASTHARRSPT